LLGSDILLRLLDRSRERDEARNLLVPPYCWFTEGFDALDPKEAKGHEEGPRDRQAARPAAWRVDGWQ
jgi:hypothetical protein